MDHSVPPLTARYWPARFARIGAGPCAPRSFRIPGSLRPQRAADLACPTSNHPIFYGSYDCIPGGTAIGC